MKVKGHVDEVLGELGGIEVQDLGFRLLNLFPFWNLFIVFSSVSGM